MASTVRGSNSVAADSRCTIAVVVPRCLFDRARSELARFDAADPTRCKHLFAGRFFVTHDISATSIADERTNVTPWIRQGVAKTGGASSPAIARKQSTCG